MEWPPEHRTLVQELLAEHGERELEKVLIQFALDSVAAARRLGVPRAKDDDVDDIPTVEDVVGSTCRRLGLAVRDVVAGRPVSAVVYATAGPVMVGEDDDDSRVVVDAHGERAMIRSLMTRGSASGAVFTVSPRELRTCDRFAPEGHSLLIFVLRSEGRAWIMTRKEVLAVCRSLEAGDKLPRFSLTRDGALRVSMPKKPTGLDMAFPRVAPWAGE